jgi:hypothetical protein
MENSTAVGSHAHGHPFNNIKGNPSLTCDHISIGPPDFLPV